MSREMLAERPRLIRPSSHHEPAVQRTGARSQRNPAGAHCPESQEEQLSLRRYSAERRTLLQRCGGRTCPPGTCDHNEGLSLQRRANESTVPSIVHEVLRSPGQALDGDARAFMEPRFGYDFSQVRVHTDSKAADSAEAVNAVAYTAGRDIVFASQQYAPHSSSGRRLLAHELTHTIQQNSAVSGPQAKSVIAEHDEAERQADQIAESIEGKSYPSNRTFRSVLVQGPPHPMDPRIQRQAGSTTTTFTRPPNVCSPDQTRDIGPAVAMAQRWLQLADSRLTAWLSRINAPGTDPTGLSLLRHFKAADIGTTRYVQNKIRLIADKLRTDPGAPSALNVQCHGASDMGCSNTVAYVIPVSSMLVFCPSFFDSSSRWQVMTMIHEIAHSLPPATGPLHITDRAYLNERLYGYYTAAEAITNAESYAALVQEINIGSVGPRAPSDTFTDECPTDWRRLLFAATARAEQWNSYAVNATSNRAPTFMNGWTDLANTYLGGQSPVQLNAALAVYAATSDKFGESIPFQCEPDGGGRCNQYDTYWYAIFSDFHICPSWRNKPSEDDRALSLLSGLYGYFGIVDDNARRWNLGRLARDLHYRRRAAPSAADVAAALTAAQTHPQPPAAPPPGPPPPR